MIPVLETERLVLRGHTLADFEPMAAMWADAGVTRFIGGKPSSREDSWGRLMRYLGHWALLNHGFWLIQDRATGAYLGDGGFGTFKREMVPPFEAPEQGWALAPSAQGKGYAAEAVAAMIAWGEAHFRRRDFVCMIAPENAPSLRVAERAGYRPYARAIYKGAESILLRRPA